MIAARSYQAPLLSSPASMKPSESVFVPVRGLRYHCRCWVRRNRASRARSRATRLAMHPTNWNEADTSIQPCSMKSLGARASAQQRQ